MKLENIITDILKQANTVSDLGKILKLNLDEKIVSQGMKLLKILDNIETKSKDIVTKNEIVDIKQKLKTGMQTFQEIQEELFAIQQRLINEDQLYFRK
jgi:hypothetical protein